ncbi:Transposase, Mutator family, partial [Alkalibacterium gilvum]
EIRRREKVVSIFPNISSAVRLIGAVLLDNHEKWQKNNNKFLKEYTSPIIN